MTVPVFPSLFYEGTDYPDVPARCAVLDVPLYVVTTGGAATQDMAGPQGPTAVYGSFSLQPYRGVYGADAVVRVRPLAFGLGREAVAATLGGGLATLRWLAARERLDDNGEFVEATVVNGDLVPGANAGLQPVFPCPIGGPAAAPLLPTPEAVGRLVSDANVRFRVTVGDSAGAPAGTIVKARLVVAIWREDLAGAIR